MRTVPRTRHYVSPSALTLCRPVLSFDYAREAYILRGIGGRVGPVLREDRRRRRSPQNGYAGPERRGAVGAGLSRVQATSTRSTARATARSTPRSTGRGSSRPKAVGQTRSKASRRARSKNTRG